MPRLTNREPMQGRTIDFPQEQYRKLVRAAREEDRTFANLIRYIASLWLEQRDSGHKDQEAA